MAVFSASVFKSTVYDTEDAPIDNGWLGGTFNDPYYESDKRRKEQERREALREAQEEVIRLKQEQQELRLAELEALRVKDKQTKRQLAAMNRRKAELQDAVEEALQAILLMQQENKRRNDEALLVLAAAFPWLNFGGETMH